MVDINITRTSDEAQLMVFKIEILENDSKSEHEVELAESDYERLTHKKITPEELIKKSFEFLLEREPKESILSKFNLKLIGKYFPEYESEITQNF